MTQGSNAVLFLESSKNIGGQELQLLQQMQELNRLGWTTKLLCKPQSRIHDFAFVAGAVTLNRKEGDYHGRVIS